MGNKYYTINNSYYDNLIKEGQQKITDIEDKQNQQENDINNINNNMNDLKNSFNDERRKQNQKNKQLENEINNIDNKYNNQQNELNQQKKELEKYNKKLNENNNFLQDQNNKINDLFEENRRILNQLNKNDLKNQKKFDEHDKKFELLEIDGKNRDKEIQDLQIKLFDHEDKFNAQDNKINDFINYFNEKDEKKDKKMNDLEKKVDEVVKMNNDLLFKFNEYVSKNEIDKMELQKQQIKMKDEFIKELEKIKSDLENMRKSKKIQSDDIKYIKEQLKNIEESKKQNDKLFEEELNDNDIEYEEITKNMNEINFRNDELNQQMENILENNDIKQNIEIFYANNLKNNLNNNDLKKMDLSNSNKNIMLISKSGMGKSTLTNYLCDLDGDKKAKTSDCEPCTKENKIYKGRKNKLNFSIIDTRGFEDENYSCDNLMKNTIKFIEDNSLNTNDKVDYLFYLIQDNDLPDEEEKELIKLKEKFPNLPIIVVNTYSQDIEEDNYNEIKKKVENLGFKFCFVNSLEIDNGNETINAFGKEKLFNIMKNEFNNSEKLLSINELNEIKNKIDLNLQIMKIEIATITEEILEKFFQIDSIELYIEKICDEIITILNKHVFEEKKEFSQNLKNNIRNFFCEYFKKSYQQFNERLNGIIKKKAESLSKKALVGANDKLINGNNTFIIDEKYLIKNYEDKLTIKLAPEMEKNAIKKCMNSLSALLFDNLKKIFENSLKNKIY